jgi:hypothetical protein
MQSRREENHKGTEAQRKRKSDDEHEDDEEAGGWKQPAFANAQEIWASCDNFEG